MDLVGDVNKRYNRVQRLAQRRLSRSPASSTRQGERQDPVERLEKRFASISGRLEDRRPQRKETTDGR